MPKPTNTWKSAEREIAERLGGKRRGPGTGRGKIESGKNDILTVDELPHWLSVEVKHYKVPTYATLMHAWEQAKRNRDNSKQLIMSAVHRSHTQYDLTVCCIHKPDWMEFFGPTRHWVYEGKRLYWDKIEMYMRTILEQDTEELFTLHIRLENGAWFVLLPLKTFEEHFINTT